jgi:hypothetical protein
VQTEVGSQTVTYKLMRHAQEMKTEGSSDIHLTNLKRRISLREKSMVN